MARPLRIGRLSRLAASSLAMAAAAPVPAQTALVFSEPPREALRDQKAELAMKIRQPFTVVAVGDMIQMVPFSNNDDPDIKALMTLMRGADVTMANNENTVVNHLTFRGTIAHMEAPHVVADDWANMGIDMMTKANNHTFDAGDEGLWENMKELQRVGIVPVGADYNETEARMTRTFATPKGTVGLIGVYANSDRDGRRLYGLPQKDPVYVTPDQLRQLRAMRDAMLARRNEVEYPVQTAGQEPDGEVLVFGINFKVGKPGDKVIGDPAANLLMAKMQQSHGRHAEIKARANELHVVANIGVTATQMRQLRAIAGAQGVSSGNDLTAWGARFRVMEKPGEYSYDMDGQDLANILREVRTGKQFNDFMAGTIHWHQNRFAFQRYSFDHYPADFEITFAHDVIDQGADLFFAHGVHTLKGVEIYKGKPIFYGLSNFVFQQQIFRSWRDFGDQQPAKIGAPVVGEGEENQQLWDWLEQPANLEALLTSSHYENGKLVEVRLYPAELGLPNRPGSQFGTPKRPNPEVARAILERVVEYSRPFGTRIVIENGVGIIRLADQAR